MVSKLAGILQKERKNIICKKKIKCLSWLQFNVQKWALRTLHHTMPNCVSRTSASSEKVALSFCDTSYCHMHLMAQSRKSCNQSLRDSADANWSFLSADIINNGQADATVRVSSGSHVSCNNRVRCSQLISGI